MFGEVIFARHVRSVTRAITPRKPSWEQSRKAYAGLIGITEQEVDEIKAGVKVAPDEVLDMLGLETERRDRTQRIKVLTTVIVPKEF